MLYTVGMRATPWDRSDFEELRALATATAGARRQHRLHAVLLVAAGLSCRAAARWLGDSPRAVEYWVQRYRLYKYQGLKDKKKAGRPPRLSAAQREQVAAALAAPPPVGLAFGARWTGAAMRAYLKQSHGVALGLRQAQRLLIELRVVPE